MRFLLFRSPRSDVRFSLYSAGYNAGEVVVEEVLQEYKGQDGYLYHNYNMFYIVMDSDGVVVFDNTRPLGEFAVWREFSAINKNRYPVRRVLRKKEFVFKERGPVASEPDSANCEVRGVNRFIPVTSSYDGQYYSWPDIIVG